MRHGGGGCGVRRGTHTGLVRVEATLDAEHHRRACETTENRLEVEGSREDCGEHRGDIVVVEDNDDRAHTQVNDRHDRDEEAGHVGQASSAAQD